MEGVTPKDVDMFSEVDIFSVNGMPGFVMKKIPAHIVAESEEYKLSYNVISKKNPELLSVVEKKYVEFCKELNHHVKTILLDQGRSWKGIRFDDFTYKVVGNPIEIKE